MSRPVRLGDQRRQSLGGEIDIALQRHRTLHLKQLRPASGHSKICCGPRLNRCQASRPMPSARHPQRWRARQASRRESRRPAPAAQSCGRHRRRRDSGRARFRLRPAATTPSASCERPVSSRPNSGWLAELGETFAHHRFGEELRHHQAARDTARPASATGIAKRRIDKLPSARYSRIGGYGPPVANSRSRMP